KHVAAWADVLNGELPGASRLDTNNDLAYVLGALGQFNVKQVGIGIGGSFWYNHKDPSGGPSNVGRRTAGGPYGYLNLESRTWMWEVAASRLLIPDKSAKTKLVTSHEISYAWRPGVDFVVNYNYVDRDLDFATGTKQRVGFGVDVDPVPFVQLQAQFNIYRINGADPAQMPPDYPEKDYVRPEIQVHMFY